MGRRAECVEVCADLRDFRIDCVKRGDGAREEREESGNERIDEDERLKDGVHCTLTRGTVI